MTPVLEIKNLSKKYESLEAVQDISFSIAPGEIVGLLGPNGAGKTTTISMLLGVLEPTSGQIKILGQDLAHHRSEIMTKVNFAAVYAHLPGNMTVWQNLYIFGLLYGVSDLKNKIQAIAHTLNIEKFIKMKCGLLSSGENTRVTLAKALLNSPSLLLLDEPTASLDPSSAHLIREQIVAYSKTKNTAVLWTSHNMQEVESVCSRVLFVSRGKILLEGDPKILPHEHNKQSLEELFIAVAREPLTFETQ
ncbi:MAG: ABC transporter ATP-binding protein [Patescibacteria group bacterium]